MVSTCLSSTCLSSFCQLPPPPSSTTPFYRHSPSSTSTSCPCISTSLTPPPLDLLHLALPCASPLPCFPLVFASPSRLMPGSWLLHVIHSCFIDECLCGMLRSRMRARRIPLPSTETLWSPADFLADMCVRRCSSSHACFLPVAFAPLAALALCLPLVARVRVWCGVCGVGRVKTSQLHTQVHLHRPILRTHLRPSPLSGDTSAGVCWYL